METKDFLDTTMGGLVIVLCSMLVVILFGALTHIFRMFFPRDNCNHDWEPWGEPTEKPSHSSYAFQFRTCRKCNMVERRSV